VADSDLTRRRFLGLAAGGAAAAALLAACGSDDDTAAPVTTTPAAGKAPVKDFGGKTITTAVYAKNHASSMLEWQRFAPPGLTVKPVIVTAASEISRLLAAGELDFGLMGYYNTMIEATTTTTFKAKVISMCSRQGIGLIARSDRGIKTVADLKGKKVAVPPPGVQVLALTAALDKVGLKLDRDVTAIPLAFADQPAALERGDVDAYMGTEPLCTQSVVSGRGVRINEVYGTPAGDINTAMWAAPKNLNDPDLLTAVARMQRDAAEYFTPNGVNAADPWHKLLVEQFEYSEPVYKAVLDNVGAVWKFDAARKAQFEGAAEMMLSQGVLTTKPKIDDLLLLDFQPKS
jgi:NitT/TauT family transport system substrate-binding protein